MFRTGVGLVFSHMIQYLLHSRAAQRRTLSPRTHILSAVKASIDQTRFLFKGIEVLKNGCFNEDVLIGLFSNGFIVIVIFSSKDIYQQLHRQKETRLKIPFQVQTAKEQLLWSSSWYYYNFWKVISASTIHTTNTLKTTDTPRNRAKAIWIFMDIHEWPLALFWLLSMKCSSSYYFPITFLLLLENNLIWPYTGENFTK